MNTPAPATRSSSKRFKAFEFDFADEGIELASKKISHRYSKPKRKSNKSPVTKYKFLQCFAQSTKSEKIDPFNSSLEVGADEDTIKEGLSGLGESAPSGPLHYESTTCSKVLQNEVVTINLGEDDTESSSSIHSSKLSGYEGSIEEQVLDHHSGGCAIGDAVVVFPDYIIYGDIHCTKGWITFSHSCIKVEGSAVCQPRGSFNIECAVGDIINIESQWCRQVETALVNLRLELRDKELAKDNDMSAGIAELRFAVYDPSWHEQEEAIKLLNVRYGAKWVFVSDFDESLKDVIYPRGDPDAVSISRRDIELLRPETFINDTIVDFYIKYLQRKIKPGEEHRFYFFNSFFFKKLADLDKCRSGAGDARAAFQRVQKWTRKVNLFEKDYIFIPVNFSLHWSLIVICHPGDAANLDADEDMQNLPKVPCILHMDSIRGSHRGLKNLFRSYLWEEWKERGNQPRDVSSKFLNLLFVSLEVPQQENSFDCGIFLLHYVELFLECAPLCFNPLIIKCSNFLNKDWFPPAEASLKRARIKELIDRIVEADYRKVPPTFSGRDNDLSPEVLVIDERDTDAAELPEEMYRSPDTCHRETPTRGIQCSEERNSEGGPLFDQSCHCFGQLILYDRFKNVMSPIEEGEETWEQLAKSYASSSKTGVSEDHLFEELLGSSPKEKGEVSASESPSTASDELAACIIEDSEEEDGVIYVNDGENSLFGLRKVWDKSKQDSCGSITARSNHTTLMLESDEKLGGKRPSPMPSEHGRRRVGGSSKDLYEVFSCE